MRGPSVRPKIEREDHAQGHLLQLLVQDALVAVAPAADHVVGDRGHVAAVGAHALAVERRRHEAARLLVRRVLLEDDGVIAEHEADGVGVAEKIVVAAGGERADRVGVADEHLRAAARQAQGEQVAVARVALGEEAVGIGGHAHELQRGGQARAGRQAVGGVVERSWRHERFPSRR